MTYSIKEELIDAMADYLENGNTATHAVDRISEEINERDENIATQDILDGFFEVYLCTPQEFEQNLKDDSDWMSRNGYDEIYD